MSFFGLLEDVRSLNQGEIDLAKTVYRGFLPYDEIVVGNKTGIGGAPWTSHSYNPDWDEHTFTLHMGPNGYADCTSTGKMTGFGVINQIFIHELGHVWQGHHSIIQGGYMAKSLWAQLKSIVRTGDRNNAYTYTPGDPWDSYNVEQQANIIEDWFAGGASESGALFPYIRDNVRR